jgi:serpin B
MILAGCWEPAVGTNRAQSSSLEQTGQGDLSGRTLGVTLYEQLRSRPGNLLMSPVSILGAFGPVANGAQGETEAAIVRSLHLPAGANRSRDLGSLLRTLDRAGDGATLKIANAMWLQQGFQVRPDFIRSAQDDYGASVDSVDFRKAPGAAADHINTWVAARTNDRIKTLVSPSMINGCTRLIITNAVYFLGDWRTPFNASDTTDRPFHLGDGSTRSAALMTQKANFRYGESDSLQMLDLPYRDARLSMTVLLPRARDGLPALEAQLAGALSGWLAMLDASEPRTVRVYLPRTRIEATYELNRPLGAMGMGIAFTSHADFGGIAQADLAIGQVIQKAFLRIDEKGTEAAAATGVTIEATSPPPHPLPLFRADHPFLFVIRERESGALLFLGRVTTPTPADEAGRPLSLDRINLPDRE